MQQVLETERLILRPFEHSDAEQVSVLAGDKRIAEMTANIPHPYKVSDAISWIETHEIGFVSGESIVYAIVCKESLELIGAVSLPSLKDGQGILGYWLGASINKPSLIPTVKSPLPSSTQRKHQSPQRIGSTVL